MPCVGLQCVFVVFPDHTRLLLEVLHSDIDSVTTGQVLINGHLSAHFV